MHQCLASAAINMHMLVYISKWCKSQQSGGYGSILCMDLHQLCTQSLALADTSTGICDAFAAEQAPLLPHTAAIMKQYDAEVLEGKHAGIPTECSGSGADLGAQQFAMMIPLLSRTAEECIHLW